MDDGASIQIILEPRMIEKNSAFFSSLIRWYLCNKMYSYRYVIFDLKIIKAEKVKMRLLDEN